MNMFRKASVGTVALGCTIVLFLVLIIGFFVFKSGYNKAVNFDETVKAQASEIDNMLKRRYDLIPNLVQTVKGYASHEKELFTSIANARKSYFSAQTPASRMQAASRMEGFLSRLLVLQERYPQLKANQGFLKLQDTLEGTENRISVARTRYNASVKQLNTFRREFFGRLYCSIAGVEKGEYFEIPEAEKEAPKVAF
jgi:LemA protein